MENGNRLLDPATGNLRPEVLALLAPLRIPVIRFPGGILADHYNWRDGVGDRRKRPARQNPMDGSTHQNNFGTDEFVNLCQALHAQALITANVGSGTLESLLAWQEFFSKNRDFPIRNWELGNEIYLAEPKERGSIAGNDKRIFHSADEYAQLFTAWSAALKQKDSQALTGAITGTSNTSAENRGWLDTLLASPAAQNADFVALHNSFAPLILGRYDYGDDEKRENAYRAMFAEAAAAGDDIRTVQQKFASRRQGKPIRIAITEHFPLFGAGGGQEQILQILDQSRTLGSALYTASLLHTYMRENVWMANYNLILSKWFGALITDTDAGLVKSPTYHVYDLYRNHFGDKLVPTHTVSAEYSPRKVGAARIVDRVPYLDCVASQDSSGGLFVAIINRDLRNSRSAQLDVQGFKGAAAAEVFTLAGSPNAINGTSLSKSTQGGPLDHVAIRRSEWTGGPGASYSFPPSSVSILHWAAN